MIQKDKSEVTTSILDELQKAVQKYSDDFIMTSDSFHEDRIQPLVETKARKNKEDNEFIANLDNDIKKTEESLKEMNERFNRIKLLQ